MNKTLVIVSICIGLFSFSIGLSIFGRYGSLNSREQDIYEQRLIKQYEEVKEVHDLLEAEKQQLENSDLLAGTAYAYGISPEEGNVLFFAHQDAMSEQIYSGIQQEQIEPFVPEPIIPTGILLLLSAVAGAVCYGLSAFFLHTLHRGEDPGGAR